MTAIFVFAALVIVNVGYCMYDGRRSEAMRQMEDYYRVEYKKNFASQEERRMVSSWY